MALIASSTNYFFHSLISTHFHGHTLNLLIICILIQLPCSQKPSFTPDWLIPLLVPWFAFINFIRISSSCSLLLCSRPAALIFSSPFLFLFNSLAHQYSNIMHLHFITEYEEHFWVLISLATSTVFKRTEPPSPWELRFPLGKDGIALYSLPFFPAVSLQPHLQAQPPLLKH